MWRMNGGRAGGMDPGRPVRREVNGFGEMRVSGVMEAGVDEEEEGEDDDDVVVVVAGVGSAAVVGVIVALVAESGSSVEAKGKVSLLEVPSLNEEDEAEESGELLGWIVGVSEAEEEEEVDKGGARGFLLTNKEASSAAIALRPISEAAGPSAARSVGLK